MDHMQLFLSVLAAFGLTMTIVSVWVKRSPLIWGPFLIFTLSLAALAKIITPIALIPIVSLLILHTLLKGEIAGRTRLILVAIVTLISIGLLIHKWPGFHNWRIVDQMQTSEGAIPRAAKNLDLDQRESSRDSTIVNGSISLILTRLRSSNPEALAQSKFQVFGRAGYKPFSIYLNFDKPFIGIFVLVLGFSLLKDLREFGQMLKVAIPLTVCGVALMIVVALYSGLVAWAPKLPRIFWFFALENLLFACIIEEAFWRGFLQKEFFRWFGGQGLVANVGCVLATAFLFAALHFGWVLSIPFLGLVFLAGIIYGSIYQFTKSLEASILCHWVFNMTHFLFFSYPVLQSAL